MEKLSPRLATIVECLPIHPGSRIIEIGCGTGAAACAIAGKLSSGHILAVDRSSKAVAQAKARCRSAMHAGKISVRLAAVEEFKLDRGERRYDFAFAIRVGALDGRHPEIEAAALRCIKAALVRGGRLFIDGGNPLKEIDLDLV